MMRTQSAYRKIRKALGTLLCLGVPFLARGHGPFDNSAHLTFSEFGLEVVITLGPDAATKFLSTHLPAIPRPQPVGMGLPLPVVAASELFGLTVSNRLIVPEEFRVLTDGLEYAFVARYHQTQPAVCQLRARYFELHDPMPPGPAVLRTETGGRLGEALLSAGSPVFSFTLPGSVLEPDAANRSIASAPIGGASPVVLSNSLTRVQRATAPKQSFVSFVVLGLVLAVVGGFLLGRNRC